MIMNNEELIFIGIILLILYLVFIKKEKNEYQKNSKKFIIKILKNWKPRGCKSEKQYETKLMSKFKKEFDDLKSEEHKGSRLVLKGQGDGRNIYDIVIDDKYFIELKYNLDSTGKMDRLIGQLDRYLKKINSEDFFLILCGKTEDNLLDRIKEKCEELSINLYIKK
tara:strand:- start:784 stop:1281 length:498 start_codon:yes stop_codon:yes gene_type:complete